MPRLNLKPNHKAIRDYYATLQEYEQQGIKHEGCSEFAFRYASAKLRKTAERHACSTISAADGGGKTVSLLTVW